MFFFFKQKTAYEMLRSLVGSEMCIRDSRLCAVTTFSSPNIAKQQHIFMFLAIIFYPDTTYFLSLSPLFNNPTHNKAFPLAVCYTCLLYTSDAADEEDSVDLGGRRIIKKKKKKKYN
eukprot:TRINITY_DN65512_c0_g1_i1.p1 TRINITY_DN65512_c0_g1~~TRINITY_DN65512_c0_g1_i1.p1  ORF type:complete len:117 (-),score=53.07 TRINITY_DN65512_c0_g1_i1:49-399(-)